MGTHHERRPRAAVALLALVLALGAGGPAGAEAPTCEASGSDTPFSLALRALNGPGGTDVYATVTSSIASCPAPDVLKKLKVTSLAADGSTEAVHNYTDVDAPNGRASVAPPDLPRGQHLEVSALVQTPEEVRTHVLRQTATVQLRPDLAIQRISAPSRVVRKQSFTIDVSVAEIAGDTSADATLSLRDGSEVLATASFTAAPGEEKTLSFPLRLPAVGSHELVATVSGASPAQLDELNDTGRAAVAVAMYDADGIVSTENRQATKVGLDVLKAGGNAIDAAAAVQFALNVVEPENSGIGGGATILVHLANGGGDFAIDAREPATAATTPRTFAARTRLDASGLSVGVPMTLRAVDEMLGRWGTRSLAESLGPATSMAEGGVDVSVQLARSAAGARSAFFPETAAVFRPGGVPLKAGDTLVQPDLAKTFRLIAAQGPDVFYRGEIAPAIVAATRKTVVAANVGTMTLEDLAKGGSDDLAADGRITSAVFVDYRGRRFVSVPGSSAGGLVTLQWLKLVERFPIGTGGPGWGFLEPKSTHVMIEAFRLAFSDRFKWMGDPRFTPVPINGLLSDAYTAQRSALINPDSRMPGLRLPGNPGAFETTAESHAMIDAEGQQTSHFSIVDRWGNAVSFTTTLADGFGSGIMVPGYGFVLNDSMTNFNLAPAANPATGDPGANDAAPGKVAMGSTAPLIALQDGEPVLVTGSPGGAFIMAVVFEVASNLFDHGKTIQQAVDAPRIWANLSLILWNPDYPAETIAALRALGHPVQAGPTPFPQVGSAESIAIDPVTFTLSGAIDPRTAPDAEFATLQPS